MKAIAIAASIATALLLASSCWAGENPGYFGSGESQPGWPNQSMKFALHMANHAVHTCTKNAVSITDTTQLVRNLDTWIAEGVDVFTVIFDYDSLSEIEYGLIWPAGWGTASTKVCVTGAIVVDGIVNPNDGIAIAWTVDETYAGCKIPNSHPGGNTPNFFIPSFSWIVPTGPGVIEIRDEPKTGNLGGVECRAPFELRGFEFCTKVYFAGTQQVSAPYSGDPPYAVEPSTWGSIKSMFK